MKAAFVSDAATAHQVNDHPLSGGRITGPQLDITIKRFADDLRADGYPETGVHPVMIAVASQWPRSGPAVALVCRGGDDYTPDRVSSEGFAKAGCQHCGNHIEFPSELLGLIVECPHCKRSTALVGDSMSVPSEPTVLPEGLDDNQIPPAPISFSYRLGLLLATVMLLLLPAVYLAMVVAAGRWTWLCAVQSWSMLGEGGAPRRGGFLSLVALVLGLAILLFLLAPLAKRRVRAPQALALNPEAEPVLYDFILRVCRVVGAPAPVRIDLDCQLNASAGFRQGAGARREFVLTLGLPLVAALDCRQFAGVLAHEFGHFTQGSGMRLSYFIRSTQLWLADLVYVRNAWDEAHEDGRASGEPNLPAFLARGLIGLTRIPLRVGFFLSRAACSFLMRQMEFDADRYEIEMAGSQAFEDTMRRLHVLRRTVQRSYEALRGCWQQRRGLPDDFPAFVLQQEAQLPLTLRTRLERNWDDGPRELMASHPSDAERVQRARQRAAPGRIQAEGPAPRLFGDFQVVSRQVTLLHYTENLGIPSVTGMLLPVQR